jgi:hypothetical protein
MDMAQRLQQLCALESDLHGKPGSFRGAFGGSGEDKRDLRARIAQGRDGLER